LVYLVEIGKSGATEITGVQPTTKVTGTKPKVKKTEEPPMARMEYTIDVKDQEGKLIKKKEQVIGEKKRD
jgi:hypothetical protein